MLKRTVAITLLFAGGALAEGPLWFADEAADPVRAKWGIPQTDAVGFEVVCEATGRVVIRPALFTFEEPAEMPQLRFDVDGDLYDRDLTLVFSERDKAWQATAVVIRSDAIISALRRGSEVTYDFEPPLREGDAFTVSLSGSASAIDDALEGC